MSAQTGPCEADITTADAGRDTDVSLCFLNTLSSAQTCFSALTKHKCATAVLFHVVLVHAHVV